MKYRLSGPHSVPDFWLWESVLNPTASGKPIFGWAAREALLPIPQMCRWNSGPVRMSSQDLCSCQGGCDGTVTGLCTAFWQWPWDLPAQTAVLVLPPLPLLHVLETEGRELNSSGSVIPRVWQVPTVVPLPVPTTHWAWGPSRCVTVGGCLFRRWLSSPSLGSKWLCLTISLCAGRLHVETCLAALWRDAQWQLMILGDRGAKSAPSAPEV